MGPLLPNNDPLSWDCYGEEIGLMALANIGGCDTLDFEFWQFSQFLWATIWKPTRDPQLLQDTANYFWFCLKFQTPNLTKLEHQKQSLCKSRIPCLSESNQIPTNFGTLFTISFLPSVRDQTIRRSNGHISDVGSQRFWEWFIFTHTHTQISPIFIDAQPYVWFRNNALKPHATPWLGTARRVTIVQLGDHICRERS